MKYIKKISRISFKKDLFPEYIKKCHGGYNGYVTLIFMVPKVQNFSFYSIQ